MNDSTKQDTKKETIKVPDIGGAEGVEIIELCVAVGDQVEEEQSLCVLESDKASMEVPSPRAGEVVEWLCKEGDTVSEGDELLIISAADNGGSEDDEEQDNDQESAEESSAENGDSAEADGDADAEEAAEDTEAEDSESDGGSEQTVTVPDIGGDDEVDVIEVCVAEGDEIEEGDSIVVLESDKASMEVPSPASGKVQKLLIKEGDKAKEGSELLVLLSAGGKKKSDSDAKPADKSEPSETDSDAEKADNKKPESSDSATKSKSDERDSPSKADKTSAAKSSGDDKTYAGPAVRKMARELGVELSQVKGSGPKDRVLKEDLQAYVKSALSSPRATSGSGIPAVPAVDFSKFGDIELTPLSKMDKLTSENMHRSWLNVPHVTQTDDVDVTDLEDFRGGLKEEAKRRGVKLSPLPFILKACAVALKRHPKINSSLHDDGEHLVLKQYVHIGMAVDTPHGLVVPVIRDVDQKSVWTIAEEVAELAEKAKNRKLRPDDMRGACFTVSSLGNIGGTGFTPIINTPEVAILGVSRLAVKPHWNGESFEPRKQLPVSLSYDHRVVNGGDAGRFLTELGQIVADLRHALM